jgi:hypothetical protein
MKMKKNKKKKVFRFPWKCVGSDDSAADEIEMR